MFNILRKCRVETKKTQIKEEIKQEIYMDRIRKWENIITEYLYTIDFMLEVYGFASNQQSTVFT